MGRLIVLSLSLLAVALCLSGAEGFYCPYGWLTMNGFCYKAFAQGKNWFDAQRFCKSFKPVCHLAYVHSYEEAAALGKFISKSPNVGNVWIGLRKPYQKHHWQWNDGSLPTYLPWLPGRPIGKSWQGAFCVGMLRSKGYLQWKDARCKNRCPFVCQCKY